MASEDDSRSEDGNFVNFALATPSGRYFGRRRCSPAVIFGVIIVTALFTGAMRAPRIPRSARIDNEQSDAFVESELLPDEEFDYSTASARPLGFESDSENISAIDILRGAPKSSPPEDAAAWYAKGLADLHQDVRNSSGERPLLWRSRGSNLVVDDEGVEVGEAQGDLDHCQASCEADPICSSFTLCGRTCFLKSKDLNGFESAHHNNYCSTHFRSSATYWPSNWLLAFPSDAPTFTYYVYRAQGPAGKFGDYPLANVNAASIGGVMWYLHNEVIRDCWYEGKVGQRRFHISRIRRFKVTTKATQPLLQRGMNYGVKTCFDFGESTGPHRDRVEGVGTGWHSVPDWERYGFFVGCNKLGTWPHDERNFQSARRYPNAVWYSFPGACPTMNFWRATNECNLNFPGGLCEAPDGRGNCTYSFEEAGEIDIDELVGITPRWRDRADFCWRGGFEGNGATGQFGRHLDFWNNIWDMGRNALRTQRALDLFHQKYPDMPKHDEILPPPCDVNSGQYYQ